MQDDFEKLPVIAQLLGYGGVVPFVLLSSAVLFNIDLSFLQIETPSQALLNYGAVIISFIGAVHWGVALTSTRKRWHNYIYGVVPALLAWVFLFMPARPALIGMAVIVVTAYFVDRALIFDRAQSGYQVLRLHLTMAVSVSLLIAAATV